MLGSVSFIDFSEISLENKGLGNEGIVNLHKT